MAQSDGHPFDSDRYWLGEVKADRVTWRRHGVGFSYTHHLVGNRMSCLAPMKRLRGLGLVTTIDGYLGRGTSGPVALTEAGHAAIEREESHA